MNTLADYYKKLLIWEDEPFIALVHEWDQNDIQKIIANFQSAISSSQLKARVVSLIPDSTNQSKGNQVESFFIRTIGHHLLSHTLEKCSGAGYPDRTLHEHKNDKKFPFEIKATSDWNPSDSNRRVPTSSSEKLRRCFIAPVCHVLTTVCYENRVDGVFVTDVRLDFIQPSTPVNIRLEASVNHKILSQAVHPSITI